MMKRVEVPIKLILVINFFERISGIQRERPKRVVQIKKQIFILHYKIEKKAGMLISVKHTGYN